MQDGGITSQQAGISPSKASWNSLLKWGSRQLPFAKSEAAPEQVLQMLSALVSSCRVPVCFNCFLQGFCINHASCHVKLDEKHLDVRSLVFACTALCLQGQPSLKQLPLLCIILSSCQAKVPCRLQRTNLGIQAANSQLDTCRTVDVFRRETIESMALLTI